MQIDHKRTDMADCPCGHPIKQITIGYGRTPYSIFCKGCKTNWFNQITNCDVDGAVKAWNNFIEANPFVIRPDKNPQRRPIDIEYGCDCSGCRPSFNHEAKKDGE